jgi:predicted signal transduction protein with EAL and GGDEF domain
VKDIPDDKNDMDITAAIIAMAQKMDLRVVAEGVETADQVDFLKNNACYEIIGDRCFIVAERDIKAKEEIFVSYSKDYWDCIRYNIKHKLYKKKK